MFIVYILYSKRLEKFYVGQTKDLNDRIDRHNMGRSKWTKGGEPWELVTTFKLETRSEAVRLEKRIKGRGIKRYLDDGKFGV